MRASEIGNGLYRIVWADMQGESLAAVYRDSAGEPYIVVCNWVSGPEKLADIIDRIASLFLVAAMRFG